jgi:oligoribonuclease (3'-5' exoribonuclease)
VQEIQVKPIRGKDMKKLSKQIKKVCNKFNYPIIEVSSMDAKKFTPQIPDELVKLYLEPSKLDNQEECQRKLYQEPPFPEDRQIKGDTI